MEGKIGTGNEQAGMNQFVRDVVTPYWWISVVIVGIIIHVVGTFVTKKLEAGSGGLSKWWLKRTAAQRERRRRAVDELLNDPHEEISLSLESVYNMLNAFFYFGIAILVLAAPHLFTPPKHPVIHGGFVLHLSLLLVEVFVGVLLLLALLGGFVSFLVATNSQNLLFDVRRERAKRRRLR